MKEVEKETERTLQKEGKAERWC